MRKQGQMRKGDFRITIEVWGGQKVSSVYTYWGRDEAWVKDLVLHSILPALLAILKGERSAYPEDFEN